MTLLPVFAEPVTKVTTGEPSDPDQVDSKVRCQGFVGPLVLGSDPKSKALSL